MNKGQDIINPSYFLEKIYSERVNIVSAVLPCLIKLDERTLIDLSRGSRSYSELRCGPPSSFKKNSGVDFIKKRSEWVFVSQNLSSPASKKFICSHFSKNCWHFCGLVDQLVRPCVPERGPKILLCEVFDWNFVVQFYSPVR